MKALRMLPFLAIMGAILWSGEGAPPPSGRWPPGPGGMPLTLDEAVQIALRQNARILGARQEIERTRGLYIEVRSQALPHVTLNASYQQTAEDLVSTGGLGGAAPPTVVAIPSVSPTPTPTPTPTATPTVTPSPTPSPSPMKSPSPTPTPTPPGGGSLQTKNWQITLQVTQVIYSGGRIVASIRIARLMEDQAIFQLRDTVDQVIFQVRREFYRVLLNRALIVVQEESVRLLESQYEDQNERYQAGTVPRFNVLQAEVALANARPALIQAKNAYYLSQLDLARTLGYDTRGLGPREAPFLPVGQLGVPPVTTGITAALENARACRPSLKAQRQNILIEVQDVIVQRAGYKPTVTANAGYTVENDPFSKNITDVVHGWFFGVQGNWNVFDGFETYGRVKQAKAKLQQACISYDDTIRSVDLEVQRAWANIEEARETVASQMKNIEQAAEALRLSRERLAAGAGTQLDILNATVALTQAQSTELQARYDYNAALAEFERAAALATLYTDVFQDPLTKKIKYPASKTLRKRVK